MPLPTTEEKERFLEYIRAGDDRATAAWRINPEYTGTLFRSLCNPTSRQHYDEEFAKAYDQAVAERGPLDPNRFQVHSAAREGRSMTDSGFTKGPYLTESQLDDFLELVREGELAQNAAGMIDPPTTITQINRRAAKDSDFARQFTEAKAEGYPAFQDRLRSEAVRQAFAGDYRALKDQMIIHLDEARQALTTNRHEISGLDGGAIRLLAEKHFADLPPEMLDEMIRVLEERELGQIGPGS